MGWLTAKLLPKQGLFVASKDYTKGPFSMAIGNGELMHKCFPKTHKHGNSKNEIR